MTYYNKRSHDHDDSNKNLFPKKKDTRQYNSLDEQTDILSHHLSEYLSD